MGSLQAKVAELVERFSEEAISSGLRWDEAVVVFGLTAKALARAAAAAGEGTEVACAEYARKRFEEAFAREIHVIVTDASVGSRDATASDNALLATARRRQAHKHH